MASADSDSGPVPAGKTGEFSVTIGTASLRFRFPDQPYMRKLTESVLAGRAYPISKLPGYKASLILDVGAGVGAAALYFHSRFPNAAIHCYEPLTANFAFLSRNVADFPAITAHPYGLYDKKTAAPIYAGKVHNYQASIFRSAETGDAAETVQLEKTADEIRRLGAPSISILKVDTEGCEVAIVAEALEAAETIDFIFVEYHSEDNRLALDRIVGPRFLLNSARVTHVHRGECGYVSRALASRYPAVLLGKPIAPEP